MMGSRSGFTLLEILVVVLIITILATIVGLNVAREPGKARAAAAKAQIGTFRTALQLYRMNHGQIPTQAQGLSALCVRPTLAPVPENYPADGYLETRTVPLDPWGRDFAYLVPGTRGEAFEVISYGADGQPGGEDDAADISSSDR